MKEITTEKELKELLKTKGKVLALFYASWCPDCTRFMPYFEKETKDKKNILKVKIDEEENSIWESFEIERIPTVCLFENGKELERVVEDFGKIDLNKFKEMVGKLS
jgi:thioredoxin-like negative regulator of GroEL